MTPSKELYLMLFEMMKEQWKARIQSSKDRTTRIKQELNRIEKKKSNLIDLIVDAEAPSLTPTYKKRLQDLECQKAILEEKLTDSGSKKGDFEEIVRTALAFLANPLNLWHSKHLEDKRAVLKLVFADRLSYLKDKGFRTAETTLPFKVLENFSKVDLKMVSPEGFEPSTY